MGLLDDAIDAAGPEMRTTKVDRVISQLHDWDDLDRLLDMLRAPVADYGHRYLAGVIRYVCDELAVDHEKMDEKDVGLWRKRDGERS